MKTLQAALPVDSLVALQVTFPAAWRAAWLAVWLAAWLAAWPMVLCVPVAAADDRLDFTLPVQRSAYAPAVPVHWRLAEHRGSPVWLVVVAPWCGACDGFVDQVVAKAASLGANGAAGPRTVASNAGGGAPLVMAISATGHGSSAGATLSAREVPVLVDRGGEVLSLLDPPDLPWLLLIDEDGRIVAGGNEIDALTPRGAESGPGGALAGLRRWWKR